MWLSSNSLLHGVDVTSAQLMWLKPFARSRQKILKLEREWGYRWTYKCGHVSSWTIHFEWPCKVLAISSRFSPWAWLSGIGFYRLIPTTTHTEKRWQLISAHFWQINSFLCTCACGRSTQVLTLLFGWLILLNSREDSIDIIYGYQNGLQLKNDQFCRSIVLTWSDPYIPIPSHTHMSNIIQGKSLRRLFFWHDFVTSSSRPSRSWCFWAINRMSARMRCSANPDAKIQWIGQVN